MRFAYADPPYLGQGRKLYGGTHPEAHVWDDPEAHRALLARLELHFPDGWALSASSSSLRTLLPMAPPNVRVMAWVKPFAVFKPGVNPAYAWEPVLVMGGRRRGRDLPTVRDWCSVNVTLRRGLVGAKPAAFCEWLCDVLYVQPGDELVDLFPGTGAMGAAVAARVS